MIFWKGKGDKEVTPDRPGETWVSRLGMGLAKSSAKLGQDISDLFTKEQLDENALERLEEILIQDDLGPKTTAQIMADFSSARFDENATEKDIREALAESMARVLEPVAKDLTIIKPQTGPFTILVCGVNGVGKTTTIGKMAKYFKDGENKSVMIAAADTFRAAAVEQLEAWSQRANVAFYKKDVGADPAAVAFEAYEKAKAANVDILMIDTAGRLHNKSNLMAELQKIIRVLQKHDPALPHATLLVLDATTGQNAFEQVRVFKEMAPVTGLVVTKLDGSARGGVLVGLAGQFGIPAHFIGVGEGADDLRPFKAKDYARSLLGLS